MIFKPLVHILRLSYIEAARGSTAKDVERIHKAEIGGREGIRTPGLLVANEALSQLSYSPTSSKSILAKALVLANTRSTACKHIGRSTCPNLLGMLRPLDQ